MSVLYWIPALLYAAVIFFFSHQPEPLGPELPTLVPDFVLHFLEYGFFAVTLVWGLTSGFQKVLSRSVSAQAWVMASLYGASDEFHQWFVPLREASFQDWTSDVLGAMGFIAVLYFLKGRRPWAPPL